MMNAVRLAGVYEGGRYLGQRKHTLFMRQGALIAAKPRIWSRFGLWRTGT